MEAVCGSALQFSSPCIVFENIDSKFNGFSRFPQRFRNDSSLRLNMTELRRRIELTRCQRISLTVSPACKDSQAPPMESGNFHATADGNSPLKSKAQEVGLCLNGRSIFLVGMMGSGKTTVAKILSEALGYSFVDSDKHVEQNLGGISVAQIFEQHGETFFRYFESEALREISTMPRQVVATGGGAVVLSINWKHMKQGVTVYLDIPWDALARRIAAVGTDSRPLLHSESGNRYTKAFMGLSTLSKKRQHAYLKADVSVSIEHIAAKLGLDDLCDVTPAAIALEVLIQIEDFLRGKTI